MTAARPLAKTHPLSSEQLRQIAEQNMRAHFLGLLKAGRLKQRNLHSIYPNSLADYQLPAGQKGSPAEARA